MAREPQKGEHSTKGMKKKEKCKGSGQGGETNKVGNQRSKRLLGTVHKKKGGPGKKGIVKKKKGISKKQQQKWEGRSGGGNGGGGDREEKLRGPARK